MDLQLKPFPHATKVWFLSGVNDLVQLQVGTVTEVLRTHVTPVNLPGVDSLVGLELGGLAEPFPHVSHLNRFSPVWTFWWTWRFEALTEALPTLLAGVGLLPCLWTFGSGCGVRVPGEAFAAGPSHR